MKQNLDGSFGSVRGIPVTIGGLSYIPPIPFEVDVKEKIDEMIPSGLSDIKTAIELVLYLRTFL